MKCQQLIAVEPWWVQSLGLFQDGSVRQINIDKSQLYIHYGESPFNSWHDISALDSSRSHVVGLSKKGNVFCTENISYRFEAYKEWRDIIQIQAGYEITAGLRNDGTVVYENCLPGRTARYKIKDVKCIATGNNDVVCLRRDGVLCNPGNMETEIIAEDWHDVDSIVKMSNIYGLRNDGTVICKDTNNQVQRWRDVIHIDAGTGHLVGLLRDGRVVAYGQNDHHQCDVDEWQNIVKIFTGCYHTVGINSSGGILTTFSWGNGWLK